MARIKLISNIFMQGISQIFKEMYSVEPILKPKLRKYSGVLLMEGVLLGVRFF